MTTKPNVVLTIPELARRVGWTRRRMLRHLIERHHATGGTLLYNVGREGGQRPRWVVSMEALKSLAPQWFNDPEQVQLCLDFLRERADGHEEEIEALKARLKALEKRIEMLVTWRKAG